jgi:4-coumarate--CoA ligase (photoactive yellow protein activation family)
MTNKINTINRLSYTDQDVLLVVQSLAQSLGAGSASGHTDAPLFVSLRDVDGFSPDQVERLARALLDFFVCDEDCGREAIRVRLAGLRKLEDWARLLAAYWDGRALCFHTSGSTGSPVGYTYTMSDLAMELDSLAPFFSSRRRIVSVMPTHHIFGHMHSILLGKWLDVDVEFAPPIPLASFFTMLREGDAVIAFPFFWQSLMQVVKRQESGVFSLPPDLTGVTAGAPCPARVIGELLSLPRARHGGPLALMEEIYGSTETNGIGIRHNAEGWYELYAHWESVADVDGRRKLRSLKPLSHGRLLDLPDILTWKDERHFVPERRVDRAVQVAGVNVYPERVADALREHPLVRDCAVRLMRPEEGSRLKAFIVPEIPLEQAGTPFGRSFRDWIACRLPTAARPKRITLGACLPTTKTGKPADWD